jgi:aspartyl-tRNA(Asn)/glutamyl-tRNA(Gln) amidotransferase subunit C
MPGYRDPGRSASVNGLYFNFGAAFLAPKMSLPRDLEAIRKSGENLGMTAKVTVEDVERVAELANLELEPEESVRMLHDLNAILDYVAQLNELDTEGVAPLAHVSELAGAGGASSLRPDATRASLDRAAVMPQAPETDQVFFKVPKVIER